MRLVAAAVAAVREAVAAVVAVVRVAVETVAVAPVGVGVARLAAVAVVAPVGVGVACLVAAAPAAAVAAMNRQMRHPLHARQHRTGAGRAPQTDDGAVARRWGEASDRSTTRQPVLHRLRQRGMPLPR